MSSGEARQRVPGPHGSERRTGNVQRSRPAVLIVDDVADNRLALGAVLRRDDLEIVTASSGREALEALLAHDVAVAILDVMMPEMDGLELAELIRGVERTRHVPIIFVTAAPKADYRAFTGYQMGAIDFLCKPLDEHVLRAKVDVLVKLEKQRRELDRSLRLAEQARAETKVLLHLAQTTSHCQSPAELYDPALDAVRELLGADRCAILLFDGGGVMRFQAWRALSATYRAAVDGHSPWSTHTEDPQPILIGDVAADATMVSFLPVFAAEGIRAIAFVPILDQRRRLLGKFMLYWNEVRTFSAHERELALTVAGQIGQALNHARLRETERAAEERLGVALAAGRMGVWEWSIPEGRVTWSPALEQLHGLEAGTFAGTFEAFASDIHPDDRPQVTAAIQEALATGRAHHVEYRIVRPDGQVRWVAGHGNVVARADGKPVAMMGVCQDITERKRAEQALRDSEVRHRTLFEVAVYGVITIDEQGVIETANPAAERLFGYPAAELAGRNITLLMPEPFHGEHGTYLQNYLRTGQRKVIGIGREVVGRRRDGSQFPMDLAVSEFLVGGKRYFKGIVNDITERKQLEQARAAAVEALERTLHDNEVFAGVLAHDLRNPLGAIVNAAQAVRLGATGDEDLARAADLMVSSGKRMKRLIDQMLDFTRARVGGGIDIQVGATDLAEVCKQAVGELELANPTWHLRVEARGDLRGTWDLDRLLQVVSNLLANAGQHGTRGEAIGIALDGTASDSVVLAVHNAGCIPEAMLPTLFAPFRAPGARPSPGLGLGLFIAKAIVDGHGGTIEVESSPAAGTTFQIRLPRHTQPRPPAPPRVAPG